MYMMISGCFQVSGFFSRFFRWQNRPKTAVVGRLLGLRTRPRSERMSATKEMTTLSSSPLALGLFFFPLRARPSLFPHNSLQKEKEVSMHVSANGNVLSMVIVGHTVQISHTPSEQGKAHLSSQVGTGKSLTLDPPPQLRTQVPTTCTLQPLGGELKGNQGTADASLSESNLPILNSNHLPQIWLSCLFLLYLGSVGESESRGEVQTVRRLGQGDRLPDTTTTLHLAPQPSRGTATTVTVQAAAFTAPAFSSRRTNGSTRTSLPVPCADNLTPIQTFHIAASHHGYKP
ncbi:hypothetical protein LZ30DRAFT_415047 [Colletotrichum cereale]|nr:hypothetical protein LZ30DRAFT_415047 [Colletotrichum cereale]